MKNKNSTSGIAEDMIRSIVHIACDENHKKTLLEKRLSEIENGLFECDIEEQLKKVEEMQNDLMTLTNIRRQDMLILYNMFDKQGDIEQWCSFKHLAVAMYCSFEAWQADENNEELLDSYIQKNKLFVKTTSKFLGIEITECAACLSDMLGGVKNV